MVVSNGILSNVGDYVLITFNSSFDQIKTINDYTDTITAETTNKFFNKEFRYSYDNKEFSTWFELNDFYLSQVIIQPSIYLEVKYTREGTDTSGTMVVSEFDFNITYITPPKLQNQTCNSCVCTNDMSNTDSSLAFNPYQLDGFFCLKNIMETAINKVYSHSTRYWRALPDQKTRDIIFKEYSLYNHDAEKCVPIMIPDNQLPDNQVQFTMSDMDFYDLPFEVQVLKTAWQEIYGADSYPAKEDALYIDILDRMYVVDSSYLFKPMGTTTGTYYRLHLIKWQDAVSNQFPTEERGKIDDLVTSFEEVFGEENAETIDHYAKPEQYMFQTDDHDNIRKSVNNSLAFVQYDLVNNWTTIAQSYYDLSSIPVSEIGLRYRTNPLLSDGTLTFTSWFNVKSSTDLTQEQILMQGIDGSEGIKYSLLNGNFIITVNGTPHPFTFTPTKGIWYGFVASYSNKFKEATLHVYSIPDNTSTVNTEFDTNELNLEINEKITLSSLDEFNLTTYYQLVKSGVLITNIRLFNKNIDFEDHSYVLNQYTVKENEYALLIDNAIKPLNLIWTRPQT